MTIGLKLNRPSGIIHDAKGVVARLRILRTRLRYHGVMRHGSGFRIGAGAVLSTPGPINFGDRVRIARNLHVETTLTVGDDVFISSNVAFIGDDHPFDASDAVITSFAPRRPAHVTVGSDCLIGFGALILGDCHIGDGAIVGAGSVVTKDVPTNAVVAGIPARVLRMRR